MNSMRLVAFLVAAAALVAPAVSVAAWSDDPSVDTPVVTAADTQGSHRLIHDGHGGFFSSSGMTPATTRRLHKISTPSVSMRRAAPSGGPTASRCAMPQAGSAPPKVTLDSVGGIIVTWDDAREGDSDIYAQRLDANGNPVWAANGIPLIATSGEDECGWSVPDGGGAIVMSYYGAVSRVTAAGTLPWGPAGSPVLYSTSGLSWAPKLVPDGQGGAFITWIDHDYSDVYAQRIGAGGSLNWASPLQLTTNDDSSDYSDSPRKIVEDGEGGFICVWGTNSTAEVRAQRVDQAGNILWASVRLLLCDAPETRQCPRIEGTG